LVILLIQGLYIVYTVYSMRDDMFEYKLISVKIPKWMINLMDDLVRINVFSSRSEIIRRGIYRILRKYLKDLKQFYGDQYEVPIHVKLEK